jgi:hypothetical protein
MDYRTSPVIQEFHGDATVASLLEAFRRMPERPLIIEYGSRAVRPGYHITEVKAGSFVTLDCGGNPDTWNETVLQVEDLGPEGVTEFMSVRKFCSIMDKVAEKVNLDLGGRLTFEVGPPETAMQVFDVGSLRVCPDRAVLRLAARPAICKPRHREAVPVTTDKCCSGELSKPNCC